MIDLTCGACPVQIQGKLYDGRLFYFRARWEDWSFRISPEPTDDVMDAVCGTEVAEGFVGDDCAASWMPVSDAVAIVQRCIRQALDA